MGHLYLVGMMGSGKSVTGKKLAAILKQPFIDLDELIQEKEKRTITEIFAQSGEPFFRQKEAEALAGVALGPQSVVATGGGAVLNPENIQRMRATGKVVYLETSIEVLWQRVRGRDERPLLKKPDPKGTLTKLFEERRAIYEKESDLRVHTDGQTAENVAEQIRILLEKKH